MFRILHGVNGRLIVAIGASLAISACSIANPYRHGDDTSYRANASLAGAIEFAEDTREKYYDAITEQTLMNRGVGVLLIGAASAAAFLGLQGGNHHRPRRWRRGAVRGEQHSLQPAAARGLCRRRQGDQLHPGFVRLGAGFR